MTLAYDPLIKIRDGYWLRFSEHERQGGCIIAGEPVDWLPEQWREHLDWHEEDSHLPRTD
jgi:hypothetical protein